MVYPICLMFCLSIYAMIFRDQFRFISFLDIHDLAISFYGIRCLMLGARCRNIMALWSLDRKPRVQRPCKVNRVLWSSFLLNIFRGDGFVTVGAVSFCPNVGYLLSGKLVSTGQKHFYLETQTTYAYPDNGGLLSKSAEIVRYWMLSGHADCTIGRLAVPMG